ncbi:hypothetical protein FOXG_22709 [Fusarium oxysporum f. sp. lycopersici 4287]|uniref:Uncharacterized protein n=1 Tax=Fusarium oxysporum f. sp. lycopersici (strain 4287 / CBS 123668 / FGSC 9935 / NRRL 34936) TaxID=426428 RepID=A0A0J9WBT1_FUSO4|nr:hypothetical protein FOXG_22709 [Fusarium oxysporum f. sp. lycopersici 4287]XP_018258038.1 hypothetical protein FOXG_22709 [Fusarium oxysporum f. sp. lycopersici 4287]XP_018258039.1 hypothetical protein FOXG_22709 [Fusarium oxysporum f. sp. lycopersici 4287]XP_018258040.1 hypothetical protein FOXG_22709 [Fusarium oxysporum f. sp. lycopersici 4287]XP_018258041.1 hypothetical protein FOXG_22709 [Fusarium oxysporum f. sp. lycopersici 4287]EWZ78888.1 hypothetical protein FOWG_16897 [Fusarium ox
MLIKMKNDGGNEEKFVKNIILHHGAEEHRVAGDWQTSISHLPMMLLNATRIERSMNVPRPVATPQVNVAFDSESQARNLDRTPMSTSTKLPGLISWSQQELQFNMA